MSDRLFNFITVLAVTIILVGGMATTHIYNSYQYTERLEMRVAAAKAGDDPDCSVLQRELERVD